MSLDLYVFKHFCFTYLKSKVFSPELRGLRGKSGATGQDLEHLDQQMSPQSFQKDFDFTSTNPNRIRVSGSTSEDNE